MKTLKYEELKGMLATTILIHLKKPNKYFADDDCWYQNMVASQFGHNFINLKYICVVIFS